MIHDVCDSAMMCLVFVVGLRHIHIFRLLQKLKDRAKQVYLQ